MRNDERESRKRSTRRQKASKIRLRISKKLYFFMFVFLCMLFYVGIYKIYDIKYVSGKDYETKAVYNQVNKVQDKIINPNRGAILDRNKQSLAMSLTVYNVVLDVREFDKIEKESEKNKIIDTLNKSVGISVDEFKEYVKKDESGKLVNDTKYKIIKKEVEYKVGQELKNQNLKCVYLEEDTKRIYPNNSLAAQVVGFIRGDSSWGLESYYNDMMTGVPGRIFRTYESDNSIVTRQEPAQEGYSLVTTIDQTIQQYAEKAIKSAYYEYNAENAAAVVMNPNTGEILAMASYPTFDLNDPSKLSLLENENYKKLWDKMSEEDKMKDSLRSWRNFNISDTFEPGSIFKPIVVASALEEGVLKENDSFFCGGKKVYGKDETKAENIVYCNNTNGHGTLSVDQVLAKSCNIGMVDIANKLGNEKFYKYQRAFGYGEKTGIDLPGEASAQDLIYTPEKLNESGVYLGTSSFGQGFNATVIQSMTAFAAVINGGKIMQPYIVSQISDKDGNIIEEHNPKVVRKVISQETSDHMRKTLEKVIADSGTGKKAKIDGYAIGGKTGTAQQGPRILNMHTCSFISYLPVENPDIMIGVFLHKPTPYVEGVTTPSPMIKEIMLNIIDYKAIPPSYEVNSNNKVAIQNSEIVVGDYVNKSVQDAVKELNSNNIKFEIVGNGDLIYKQSPINGNKIDKSTKIIIFAKQSDSSKELVIVPNVVGMPSDAAKTLLEKQGFLCEISTGEGDDSSEISSGSEKTTEKTTAKTETETKNGAVSSKKNIVEQYPNPEVKVEKGTIIKIIEE